MALSDPRPFSATELRRIGGIAKKHPHLGALLQGRARMVLAEPHLAGRGSAGEAIVAIYDYDTDRTLVATIHPRRGRVLSVEESPAHFQLSEEEQDKAESLARTDKRVKSFLGRRSMNPLTRLYFPPNASQHRHAIVFLRPNSSERAYAMVDLSDERVVDVLSAHDFAG